MCATVSATAAIPLGPALPQGSSDQPGRSVRNTPAGRCRPARRPYSVLLRVGFAMPLLLPVARCALAAPFHPCCPGPEPGISGLLSVALSLALSPKGPGRRALPATLVSWSPDFPRYLAVARLPGPPAGEALARARQRAKPRSRSTSSSNSSAPIWPSISPSMRCGRQRRWNARTAARPSAIS